MIADLALLRSIVRQSGPIGRILSFPRVSSKEDNIIRRLTRVRNVLVWFGVFPFCSGVGIARK
jgi:hypothetical protein